jgi:N-glycosidase YbiA
MIKFYSPRHRFGCFSNFSRHPIEIDGKVWPTSEHFYQAQKTLDPTIQEIIRRCSTPRQAADLGRSIRFIRQDWEQIKYAIMKRDITVKVEQHQSIKDILLSTGDEYIAEASPKDYIWGIGADGSGQNWLGQIYMEVRDEIRDKEKVNVH